MMKLTVVIPVYNAENFIKKSYKSIIDQNLKDFEIIYVDNNSTDSSISEIERLRVVDSRISLCKEAKQGAGPARNLGLKNARGEYIYMFDVDDEIYPGALNKMIDVLDAYKDVDAVFGKMVKSTKGILETPKPHDETDSVILQSPPYWGLVWFEDLKTVVGPPAFLYRKSILDSLGGYNESLLIGEDTALDIELGMTTKIAFLDSYVYLYFKHEASSLEQSKKSELQVFNLWERLTLSNLPFYLTHNVPFKYKELLFGQLYITMGKLIFHTKGFWERMKVYKSFRSRIFPLPFPFYFRSYLVILVVFPMHIILKFYKYYWSPWYVNRNIKKM